MNRLLLLLLVPVLLTGCGPTEQEKADYAAVERSGVPSATYDKMVHGDALSLTDIENLAHARVNDGITLRYLRDQGTIYTLNSGDVTHLRQAGVSPSIVDYMLQTAREYYTDPYLYDPYYGGWYGPWYGPGFFGFYGPHYHHFHGGGRYRH